MIQRALALITQYNTRVHLTSPAHLWLTLKLQFLKILSNYPQQYVCVE